MEWVSSGCCAKATRDESAATANNVKRRMKSPEPYRRGIVPCSLAATLLCGLRRRPASQYEPASARRRGDRWIGTALDVRPHVPLEQREVRVFHTGARELQH